MTNLTIRECEYKDLDNIISLQKQWADEEITYEFVPVDKSYLESKLGEYFLIAELNGEIVDFIYGSIHKAENISVIENGQFYIEIDDVYMTPNCRDRGIGTILLDKILEISKENEVNRSLIYSSKKDMESIMKFYKKHGYKTWCVQMFK